MRCANAVQRVGYFGPVLPYGQGDCQVTAVSTVFPFTGLLKFLLSPTTQMMS